MFISKRGVPWKPLWIRHCLDTCIACPGIGTLRTSLTAVLEDNMIDNVTYRQWVTVDRSSLEIVSKTSDEFIDASFEKILVPHSFIATQQASLYKEQKPSLKPRAVGYCSILLFFRMQPRDTTGITFKQRFIHLLSITGTLEKNVTSVTLLYLIACTVILLLFTSSRRI